MRYAGQGYELEVPVPAGPITGVTVPKIESDFRASYRKAYGYEPEDPTEVVTFRVVAVGNLPPLELPAQPRSADTEASHAIKSARPVYFDGNFQQTAVYDGHRLQSGNHLQGPAIIELRESTIVVLPTQQAVKGDQGEVVISTIATNV